MLAGVAGCVYTWVIAFVSPDSFRLTFCRSRCWPGWWSGGSARCGPLLGAAFVMFVPSFAQDVNQAAPGVMFGLLIIAVMYLAPTGLAGLPGRLPGTVARTRASPTDAVSGTRGRRPVPDPGQAAPMRGPTPRPAVVDAEPVGAPPRTEKE